MLQTTHTLSHILSRG